MAEMRTLFKTDRQANENPGIYVNMTDLVKQRKNLMSGI